MQLKRPAGEVRVLQKTLELLCDIGNDFLRKG